MPKSLFVDPRPLNARAPKPVEARRRHPFLRDSDIEWMEHYGYDFDYESKKPTFQDKLRAALTKKRAG